MVRADQLYNLKNMLIFGRNEYNVPHKINDAYETVLRYAISYSALFIHFQSFVNLIINYQIFIFLFSANKHILMPYIVRDVD